MPIASAFNQTANWYAKSGKDKFGKYSYAAAVEIPCRIQLKRVVVRKQNNQDILADGKVFAAGTYNFSAYDKLEYTDSSSVVRRFEIVEVYEARNRTQLNHKELFLKYAEV